MVFVSEPELRTFAVVPLGCMLSWNGYLASVQEYTANLAPELLTAMDMDIRKYDMDKYRPLSADVFAVAAMMLDWLTDSPPRRLASKSVVDMLSDDAYDFFSRSLQKDSEWRLSIDDALAHRWLKGTLEESGSEDFLREHASKFNDEVLSADVATPGDSQSRS